MIDLHCHVLPDVDDGAQSWEMAVQMCAMAWQDGIEHIVATPHANDEYFYDRGYCEELLQKLCAATGGQPALSLGCDFHFSYENIQDALANPGRFTIDRTPYLLIELSDYSVPPSVDNSLAKLISIGLKPIMTHPERNPVLQRAPERVLDWVRAGCAIQVTANALTGRWGRKADATARWLFDHHAVHILATDAHSLDSRPPILSPARDLIRQLTGDAVSDALVNLNPGAVIHGDPLPYFPGV